MFMNNTMTATLPLVCHFDTGKTATSAMAEATFNPARAPGDGLSAAPLVRFA